MVVINASILLIAVTLILSEGWLTGFHEWVQAKVAESA